MVLPQFALGCRVMLEVDTCHFRAGAKGLTEDSRERYSCVHLTGEDKDEKGRGGIRPHLCSCPAVAAPRLLAIHLILLYQVILDVPYCWAYCLILPPPVWSTGWPEQVPKNLCHHPTPPHPHAHFERYVCNPRQVASVNVGHGAQLGLQQPSRSPAARPHA